MLQTRDNRRGEAEYAESMDMNPSAWTRMSEYLVEVFGVQDEQRRTLMERAGAAGFPQIAVSADVGRALQMFASMTNAGRGARRAVELGTLAGYSALWIVRGLAPDGRLVCIEPEARHADFAQNEFVQAGVADRIEIRRTTGLAALDDLAREHGPGSIDFLFIDAIKSEYPDYFRAARPLIAPGGVVVADNTLGNLNWNAPDPAGTSERGAAVDRMNRMIAADSDFIATCFPNREGITVAWRRPG